MQLLIFGDDIGHGQWDEQGGWVERLRQHVNRQSMQHLDEDHVDIYNLSVVGETTTGLRRRITQEILARQHENDEIGVIIAIGTNDTAMRSDRPLTTPEEFQRNIAAIYAAARSHAKQMVFVGLPSVEEQLTTPWQPAKEPTTFTNQRLAYYEQVIMALCAQQKATFIPLFAEFSRWQSTQQLLTDGLHPNAQGHEFILSLIQPTIMQIVQKNLGYYT